MDTSAEINAQLLSLRAEFSAKAENPLYNQYEEKIRPCIDLIDSLRTLGVENDLALPKIAVIGDQSSGKSSVLEALSGVALPRGSGIVTRCPLVLRLKKLAPQKQWKGKISYRDINEELHDPTEVEKEIRKAQNAMAGEGVGISQELISLEISSPHVPDLTLIDLPGIARVAVGNQPQDIGEQIKKLIKTFIAKQESINLVVVPSNVDIATTEALRMAQEVDPDGERTLGILTKPDLVDRGTEESVVDIVRNLVIHLRKGYMIVKCRGQQDIHDNLTLASAIQKERAFFEEHEHFRVLLDENKATVPVLADKLTTELVEHINKSLPSLEEQINIKLQAATQELRKYGKEIPKAEGEKLFFLIDKIKLFNQDIMSSVAGEENLFADEIRLFTIIRIEFQKWGKILDDIRKTIQHEVWRFEKQYRGRELPGFISYKTFESIVRQQVTALEEPAIEILKKVTGEFYLLSYLRFNNVGFSTFWFTWQKFCLVTSGKIVRKSFTEIAINHFKDFHNLNRAAKVRHHVLSTNLFHLLSDSNVFITILCFQSAGKRLSSQIPLIIQFYILQEFGDKLQNSMLQLLQEKENLNFLLQERKDAADQRQFLSGRISRLTQARLRLIKSSVV
uniref:Uncharacterized protein n=1 Tax=Pelusios castaneus TaxID=367368 RepID=A0A8C8SQ53_9SAUR